MSNAYVHQDPASNYWRIAILLDAPLADGTPAHIVAHLMPRRCEGWSLRAYAEAVARANGYTLVASMGALINDTIEAR